MPTLKKNKRHRKKKREMRRKVRSDIISTLLASSIVIVFIVLLVWFFLPGANYSSVINSAGAWMIYRQEESGHFKYEYNPWLDAEVDDDNLVRQAGAAYIMGELFDYKGDGAYLDSAVDSLRYFNTLTKYDDRDGIEIAYIENDQKTGTIALATIACEHVRDTWLWNSDLEKQCNGYLNFLDFVEGKDGGFSKKYYLGLPRDAIEFETQSPYYNGEAWLALSVSQGRKNSPALRERLEKHFDYFDNKYRTLIDRDKNGEDVGKEVIGFYLWGMRAINRMHIMDQKPEYADFAYMYTNHVIEDKGYMDLESNKRDKINDCYAFEGVVSAYAIAKREGETEITARWKPMIEHHLERLKNFQVKNDITAEEVINGRLVQKKLPNPNEARGGFLNSLKEDSQYMRIDFTQHCIGAYLLAEEWL